MPSDEGTAPGGVPPEVEDENRVAVAILLSEVRFARGEVDEACELLEDESRDLPAELDLHMAVVKMLANRREQSTGPEENICQQRLLQAADRARRTLEERFATGSGELLQAALDLLCRDFKGAHQRLRKAVLDDPLSSEAHGLLGMAYAGDGKHARAARSFREALRLEPGSIGCRLGLAGAHAHLGEHDKAEELYREVLATTRMNVQALAGLGGVLAGREDADEVAYDDAAGYLEEALRAAATMERDLAEQRASVRLSAAQRATIHYRIGCCRARQYEVAAAGGPSKRQPALLRAARYSFHSALQNDPGMFRARRSKAKVEQAEKVAGFEPQPWVPMAAIVILLVLLTSSFVLKAPRVSELGDQVYAGMTLGLLVLLMATLYLPRLRSLSVAGVSMEKDVDSATLAAELSVEEDPNFLEFIPPDIPLPSTQGVKKSDSESGAVQQAQEGIKAQAKKEPQP